MANICLINYEAFLTGNFLKYTSITGDWMIVLDESSKIKNFKALTTKALLKIRDRFKYRVAMSGTPAPNCDTEYWSQITFVKDGVLPKSFYAFRNIYFHLGRNGQVMFTQGQVINKTMAREIFSKGWKYEITKENRERLLKTMKPYCHYARKEDCLDLPDQIDEIRDVELTAKESKIYKDMCRDLIAEINGKEVVAQVALTKICKLREITSGFCITPDGEEVDIGESSKLKELSQVIDELGAAQAIIWVEYKHEARQIKELLGEKAVELHGAIKESDREANISAFKNKQAQYLIAHPRSAAHGLTFVNCQTQIFYSMSYSYELYEQCRGRTYRHGQKNNCLYIHLIAKNTIDKVILKVVRDKQGAQELVKEFLR